MLNYRAVRPFVVLLAALALLAPTTPAHADKRNPTPAELRAAQQRVAAAKSSVVSLQIRAERAAEAYNGAKVAAQRAAGARAAADLVAQAAQARYATARDQATLAQTQADAAALKANDAEAAATTAEAEAAWSQRKLDLMAVGAYRSGGQIGVVSQLMLATDPLELANGSKLMNEVAGYQQQVIRTMQAARSHARVAAQAALASQRAAATAADHAASALAVAAQARSTAQAASDQAAAAAADAHRLLVGANQARALAQRLVSQAEAELGHAVLSAKALQRAAEAARRAAATVHTGTIPNDQAGTAIHWAFQEIGVPYSWGGGDENGPTRGFAQGADTVGFDCSGLTLFIYAKAGIHLDHYTGSQWNIGKRISSRADLKPGDLMYFAYDTSNPDTIHHVAIYIGDGKLIEAPYTGAVVRVASADRSDFIGATRPWVSS